MLNEVNYKKKDGKYIPIGHNRRIHNFFHELNILLPIEKRLSDTEIERISSFLYEVLEEDNKKLKNKQIFSTRQLIAIFQDLLEDGFPSISFNELMDILNTLQR